MKKRLFKFITLILALCFILSAFAGCNKMAKFDIGDLPIVEITTQGGKQPKNKTDYVNCSFSISNCEDPEDDFSVEMKSDIDQDDSVGIRLRGNSTMQYDKKPYRIKFDKKQSLFGNKKNKNWVLLADYLDTSKIRNYTAFKLASEFENLDFTPDPHHVVLYLNGECKGLYLMCEQIDEKEGRANVEVDEINPDTQDEFPFLIEMDRNAHKEGVTGIDNFNTGYFQPIEIKYPEQDERGLTDGAQTDEVFDYIKGYMTAVFETLTTGNSVQFMGESKAFEDLVDVDSFIEYYLVNEVMFNKDSTWGSIYMHKTASGKLKFGPVWDFDWSVSDTWTNEPYGAPEKNVAKKFCHLDKKTPFTYFIQNQDNFEKVCDAWDDVKENLLDVAVHLGEYKEKISVASKVDLNFWHGNSGSSNFDTQYDFIRMYLLDRYTFLSKKLVSTNYNEFLFKN